jgi:hypothetical protein
MDAGTAVAAFTATHKMKVYRRRRLDVFCNRLVYTFTDGREPYSPTIMTLSRVLAE